MVYDQDTEVIDALERALVKSITEGGEFTVITISNDSLLQVIGLARQGLVVKINNFKKDGEKCN